MINDIQKLLLKKRCQKISGPSIKLEEKQASMAVNIEGLSETGLKINIDKGKQDQFHPTIIVAQKNYRKCCDYIILVPDASVINVYFIELKKTISHEQDPKFEYACNQILCTVPFWEYLVSMVATHFGETPQIKKHFAVIADERGQKRPTRYEVCHPYKGKNFTLVHSQGTVLLQSLQ